MFEDLRKIPDELNLYMKKRGIKYKSPYSHSYYNKNNKSWDFTENGTIRVANHWNFKTLIGDKIHCPIEKIYENKYDWIVAKYDSKTKKYKFVKGFMNAKKNPQHFNKLMDNITKNSVKSQLEKIKVIKRMIKSNDTSEFKKIFRVSAFPKSRIKELKKFSSYAFYKTDPTKTTNLMMLDYNNYHNEFSYTPTIKKNEIKQLPLSLVSAINKLL